MSICFFIGHRDAPEALLKALEAAVERRIVQCGVTEFLIGSHGAFDHLAARAVRSAKQRHPDIRMTLLLAYYDPKKPDLPLGFDGSLIPLAFERVPRRAAIVRANRQALALCAHLIAYDAGQVGNTHKLMALARRREAAGLLRIENLGEGFHRPP